MLLKSTVLYLPAQVISPLLQLATIISWAHYLSATEVGVLTLVVAFQELSFGVFYTWWTQHALRYLPAIRRSNQQSEYLSNESAVSLVLVVLQLVILTPIIYLYFREIFSLELLSSILAFIVSRSIANFLSERARAERNILVYSLIQILVPGLALLGGILSALYINGSAIVVLFAFSAAQMFGVLIGLIATDFGRNVGKPSWAVLKAALIFGVPVMAASMLAIVANNGPRFIVDKYSGYASVGMFAISYGFGLRVASFASMLVTAGAYPLVVAKMEEGGIDAAYSQLHKNILMLVAILMPAGLGIIAINKSLIDIFFPADFAAVALTVLPLSAVTGMMRDMRNHTTNQVFLLHSQTKFSTLIALGDVFLSLLFSTMGVILWGASGAVLGPLIATTSTLLLSISIAYFRFSFDLPWRGCLKIFASAAAMAVTVSFLPQTNNLIWLGAEILAGGLTYATLLAILYWPLVRIFIKRLPLGVRSPDEI